MDKLLNILSELQITEDYIAPEIAEIESLSENITSSMASYQANCEEIQSKTKEIEDLKEAETILHNKIIDREKEFAIAMEKLENLHIEYESLKTFKKNELGLSETEVAQMLENKTKLFGLDVQAHYTEPNIFQAKISFAEDKFVILKCEMIQNIWELETMDPKHPNFEGIRRFLFETGDIAGFLCSVRKYFRNEL